MQGPSPRIIKQTKNIVTDPVPGIEFKPDQGNYNHFFIEVEGIAYLSDRTFWNML